MKILLLILTFIFPLSPRAEPLKPHSVDPNTIAIAYGYTAPLSAGQQLGDGFIWAYLYVYKPCKLPLAGAGSMNAMIWGSNKFTGTDTFHGTGCWALTASGYDAIAVYSTGEIHRYQMPGYYPVVTYTKDKGAFALVDFDFNEQSKKYADALYRNQVKKYHEDE